MVNTWQNIYHCLQFDMHEYIIKLITWVYVRFSECARTKAIKIIGAEKKRETDKDTDLNQPWDVMPVRPIFEEVKSSLCRYRQRLATTSNDGSLTSHSLKSITRTLSCKTFKKLNIFNKLRKKLKCAKQFATDSKLNPI